MHRPMGRRVGAVVGALVGVALVAGSVATTGAGAQAASQFHPAAVPRTTPADPGLSTPWLHVQKRPGQLARIVDASGREIMLRGANSEGMEDEGRRSGANPSSFAYPLDAASYTGTCPANSNEVAPPLCEEQAALPALDRSTAYDSHNDFAQMRAEGFNVVRLAISWSQLEPTPGHYGGAYLDHIAQIVGWARSQGVYVLLDMHQDGYSRFLQPDPAHPCAAGSDPAGGFDGAPAWAVITDGKPACAVLGQSVLNPALLAAFDHFWRNDRAPVAQGDAPGPGLQDHWIGAMASLARRFHDEPAVLGYEIMNEPQPGSFNAFVLARDYAYPFYRRAIEALTGERDGLPACPANQPSGPVPGAPCAYPDLGIGDRHLMAFEPVALRNLVDFSPEDVTHFSHYPNLVLAPHTYTHVFTVDRFIGYEVTDSPYPPSYDFAYATAASQAEGMGAAVLVTEFGTGSDQDQIVTKPLVSEQERWKIGSLEWTWKANCSLDAAASCSGDGWSHWVTAPGGPGLQPQNGPVRPSRALLLRRVYPMRTAGLLGRYRYDPDRAAAVIEATATGAVDPADPNAATIVFVPGSVTGPITVSGAATLTGVTTRPDGARIATVAPTAAGAYQVTVGASADVDAVATALAAEPAPTPIGLAAAEKTFFAFLDLASHSPIPKMVSQAALVRAIATSILTNQTPPTTVPPTTVPTTVATTGSTTTTGSSDPPGSAPATPVAATPAYAG